MSREYSGADMDNWITGHDGEDQYEGMEEDEDIDEEEEE